MSYEIITLKEMKVVGIGTHTTNENQQAMEAIGNTWEKFMGVYETIKGKTTGLPLGVYTHYEGDFTKPYDFYACCEATASQNPDLTSLTIPQGTYAKFSLKGDTMESVGPLWQEIWETPLQRTYATDFEIYNTLEGNPKDHLLEIYIGIES